MATVCGLPTKGRYGNYPWPCTRAAGHGHECTPEVDALHYPEPLNFRDVAWLASEIRLLHMHIARMEKEAQEDDTRRKLGRLIKRLVDLAPANAKRKNVPAAEVTAAWQEAIG